MTALYALMTDPNSDPTLVDNAQRAIDANPRLQALHAAAVKRSKPESVNVLEAEMPDDQTLATTDGKSARTNTIAATTAGLVGAGLSLLNAANNGGAAVQLTANTSDDNHTLFMPNTAQVAPAATQVAANSGANMDMTGWNPAWVEFFGQQPQPVVPQSVALTVDFGNGNAQAATANIQGGMATIDTGNSSINLPAYALQSLRSRSA